MPVRAFLDTSVLHPRHWRHELVKTVRRYSDKGVSQVELYWSPWVIGELYRNLAVARLREGSDEAQIHERANRMMEIMTEVVRAADPAAPYADIDELTDPDDRAVWWGAASVKAEFLVTLNSKHSPAAGVWTTPEGGTIRFVLPQQFLDHLETVFDP